jgi:putative DNA primase/helicase
MTLDEAIDRACSEVGVEPPRRHVDMGRWVPCDVVGKGAAGKGDGRLICDGRRATAVNWTTGEKATVWLEGRENISAADRRAYARQVAEAERAARQRAEHAARIATQIVEASTIGRHAYLKAKGFPEETALLIGRDRLVTILEAGRKSVDSLVVDAGVTGLVVPARIGKHISSVQIIWENGTKKFLAGAAMQGATHRIATGGDTWLCEGFVTGLSLRTALRALSRRDTVLVCFSAANVARVASALGGRRFIAADHDAPPAAKPDQFGGLGAGEYFARKSGCSYLMPPIEGMDVNDLHQDEGIFAVQRLISMLIREARM